MERSLQTNSGKVFGIALFLGVVNTIFLALFAFLVAIAFGANQITDAVVIVKYYFTHAWLWFPGISLTVLSIVFMDQTKKTLSGIFSVFFPG